MKNYQTKSYMVKLKFYLLTFYKIFRDYKFKRALQFYFNYFKILKKIKIKLNDLNQKEYRNAGESFEKYLDYKFWILENLIRVYNLNLDKFNNLKILDIGTGFGYFPFICEYFGNYVEAIDLDSNVMYNDVIKLLNIKRHSYRIDFNKILPFDTKFDLITGYMICFNNHKSDNLWRVNEWSIFLQMLKSNNLNKNGTLFFSFNLENDNKPFSLEIKNFFLDKNAIIKNNEVLFKMNL